MALSGQYSSTTDPDLQKDVLHQAAKMKLKVWHYCGKGTMGTPGATAVITLTLPLFKGVAMIDDDYNLSNLFIVDDNGALCSVVIDDSTGATPSITVDTTAADTVVDETTAGAFTTALIYDVIVVDVPRFIGFSTQEFLPEVDVETFKDDDNQGIEEDITEGRVSVSGELRSFAFNSIERVNALTQYGSQTGQEQYHGGLKPTREKFALVLDGLVDTAGKSWEFVLFKGYLRPNGATATSPVGYKVIPYAFTGLSDMMRDNNGVNAFSIKRVG